MSKEIKISPSMLACDFTKIGEEIDSMVKSGADMLHLDVMDGLFVPNISFGLCVIEAMRKKSDIFFDTHLMIDRPERYVEHFVKAGSDNITIHVEACNFPVETLKKIREYGVKASISIKPKTPVSDIAECLPYVDMVLVMTVEPGFGGQSFMADMMPKIEELVKARQKLGLDFDIQVDGGISESTIEAAASAGANVFVAGSAVFKSADRAATIKNMKEISKKYFKGE